MISIILIEYLNINRTIKYLSDFYKKFNDQQNYSIVLVDNSNNDTNYRNLIHAFEKHCGNLKKEEMIPNENRIKKQIKLSGNKKNIVFIQTQSNYGFAIGNNIGFKVAEQIFEPERVVFSNNDIQFNEVNIFSEMNSLLDLDNKAVMVSPKITGLDGVGQTPYKKSGIWERWIIPYGFWMFNAVLYKIGVLGDNAFSDLVNEPKPGYVYRIMGSFFMADTKKFNKMRLFDENTFLYAEEMILAEKAIERGFKTIYTDKVSVLHEQNSTIGRHLDNINIIRKKLDSEMYYYHKYRKKSLFVCSIAKTAVRFFIKTRMNRVSESIEQKSKKGVPK